VLDETDRAIVNELQGGFPLAPRPFEVVAERLGLSEDELVGRIADLRERGILTRFGPMFNAEAMGGGFCLCAMAVPAERFDAVATQINAHPEVAHNYAREHALNMWFVLAAEAPGDVERLCRVIEAETGLPVLALPKLREFFVAFKVQA
jgi:DNA-binding Lrp family transcriptional regulator